MCYYQGMQKWRKPLISEEMPEFERTAVDLRINLRLLTSAFDSGELVELANWIWCLMVNTDSNEVFSIAEAEAKAELYGRDIARVFRGMTSHAILPAPIVLVRGDERPYLVSGNTRLMAARVLNVRPKVWLIRMEASNEQEDQHSPQ